MESQALTFFRDPSILFQSGDRAEGGEYSSGQVEVKMTATLESFQDSVNSEASLWADGNLLPVFFLKYRFDVAGRRCNSVALCESLD